MNGLRASSTCCASCSERPWLGLIAARSPAMRRRATFAVSAALVVVSTAMWVSLSTSVLRPESPSGRALSAGAEGALPPCEVSRAPEGASHRVKGSTRNGDYLRRFRRSSQLQSRLGGSLGSAAEFRFRARASDRISGAGSVQSSVDQESERARDRWRGEDDPLRAFTGSSTLPWVRASSRRVTST